MNDAPSSSTNGQVNHVEVPIYDAWSPLSPTSMSPAPQGSHQGYNYPSTSQPDPQLPANPPQPRPYMAFGPRSLRYQCQPIPPASTTSYSTTQPPQNQYNYSTPGASLFMPSNANGRRRSRQSRMPHQNPLDYAAQLAERRARQPLNRPATNAAADLNSYLDSLLGIPPPRKRRRVEPSQPETPSRDSAPRSIISSDWDFQRMGVGGLDEQFDKIFRRAFASRIFPLELTEQLNLKHVRGILLYGPPGTGKTLIARQIAKMLNAREPKVVNGPEVFHKWVGESEEHVRKLFADAEQEWQECGSKSALHVIIFDELDAICRQRGRNVGSDVGDKIVNQLLTKIDGFEQLNNILVIGMTNRRDMIDTALLRPGRIEVQLEISLPDEKGRVQILNIHTAKMRECEKLHEDVDIDDIAKRTVNFSGAEIEGLVRAAQSSAMNRLIKVGKTVNLDDEASKKLKVTMEDFNYALANDVKASTITADVILEGMLRGELIKWCPEIDDILEIGRALSKQSEAPKSRGLIKLLITGAPNTGKTYLAAKIAKDAGFSVVKICRRESMIGMSDDAKCHFMQSMFDDACKSTSSVLLIDNIEAIIGYTPIGKRFSNSILQELLVLLNTQPPVGHRLLILATSSTRTFMEDVGIASRFSKVITIRQLQSVDEFITVIQESGILDDDGMQFIREKLKIFEKIPVIGIKSLLELLDFVSILDNPAAALILELQKLAIS
uniref:Vesicle-fusing ATPase n=1 Tax=Panagrellus redivivus TaxID=6233 RepID=A0A7E4V1Q7_PANRE